MSNELGSLADVQREWHERFEKQLLRAIVAHPDVTIGAKALDDIAKEFGRPHTARSLAKKIEKIKGGPARASTIPDAADGGGVSQRTRSPSSDLPTMTSDEVNDQFDAMKKRQRQADDDDEDFSPVNARKKRAKISTKPSIVYLTVEERNPNAAKKPVIRKRFTQVKEEPGVETEFGEY